MFLRPASRRHARALCISTALALPALPACVNTSPDRVQLTGQVDSVMIAVEATALVTVITGSFDLELALGDLASEDSTAAEPPSLRLVVADNQALIRALDAVPEGESFPLTVSPGETRVLTMVLTDQNLLPGEGPDAVCGRGNLQIVGSLDESLSDRAITFSSAPFVPTNCP